MKLGTGLKGSLFEKLDEYTLDRVVEVAARGMPIYQWGNIALVCRSFASAARRVFPQLRFEVGALVQFSRESSHPEIAISNGPGHCVLTKTLRGGYTWATSKGVPLGIKQKHRLIATHTTRVQGGGFISVVVSQGSPPQFEATTRDLFIFYPTQSCGFVEKMPTKTTAFAALGTVSGDLALFRLGQRELKSAHRLDAQSGSVFRLEYDVMTDTLVCFLNDQMVISSLLFGDRRFAAGTNWEQATKGYRLYWALTLFADGTVFDLDE